MDIPTMKELYDVVPGSLVKITTGRYAGKLGTVHAASNEGLHVTSGKTAAGCRGFLVKHGDYTTRYWEA